MLYRNMITFQAGNEKDIHGRMLKGQKDDMRKADLFLFASLSILLVTFVFTCWESLVMSTGLILLKAESLSSLSLACCSTAITKAS